MWWALLTRRSRSRTPSATTGLGNTEWGDIFVDTVVAAAMLDRLLHRATFVAIDGDRYRLRSHHARADALRKGVAVRQRR